MFAFSKAPYVRYFLLLATGILLAYFHAAFFMQYSSSVFVVLVSLSLGFLTLHLLRPHQYLPVKSAVIGLVIVLYGIFLIAFYHPFRGSTIAVPLQKAYAVQVLAAPLQTKSSWLQFKVKPINPETIGFGPNAQFLLYLKNNAENAKVLPTDIVLLNELPKSIPPPANPKQFNFAHYSLVHKTIGQLFVNYTPLKWSAGNFQVRYWVHGVRLFLFKTIEKSKIKKENQHLLHALLLGTKKDVGKEQRSLFLSTGVLHVLAVSGMHVGIVLVLFSNMLFWLKKRKTGKFWHAFFCALVLLLFVLLTGASASVIRAALFAILFMGFQLYSIRIPKINGLAFIAFLILLFDPFALLDVGFQLSFLSVASIFLNQAYFNFARFTKSRLVKAIVQPISISLAAQVLTFPLAFHYFGFFSFVFPIANLWVAFCIVPIVYLGMLHVGVLGVFGTDSYGYIVLDGLFHGLQYGLSLLESDTLVEMGAGHIGVALCLGLEGVFLLVLALLYYRRFFLTWWIGAMVVLCVVLYSIEDANRSTSEIIVYDLPKAGIVEVHLENKRMELYWNKKKGSSWHTEGFQKYKKTKFWKEITISTSLVLCLEEFEFVWLTKPIQIASLSYADVMVISNNAIKPDSLPYLPAKKIILDGSNSIGVYKKSIDRLKREKIDVISTRLSGAQIIKLP